MSIKINKTIIMGLSHSLGKILTVKTPKLAPKMTKGIIFLTSLVFTLPDRIYSNELLMEAIDPCNLFVPSTICGDNPTDSKAGTEINPPPPATESTKAVINPITNKNNICSTILASLVVF